MLWLSSASEIDRREFCQLPSTGGRTSRLSVQNAWAIVLPVVAY